MDKQTIALIFGGQSSEHEVSCLSAANVADRINTEKYDVILIGITKKGHWIKADKIEDMRTGTWLESKISAVLSPDATQKCIILSEDDVYTKIKIDLVFPVLHGLYGEDGTIQGLCELSKIPYVGCGVLASSVGMDKIYTKIIAAHIGIEQASFEAVSDKQIRETLDVVITRIEKRFVYPVFIKPSNSGSSRGVSKAKSRQELITGLKDAALHDRKILVEETIVGHELECAVLGGGKHGVSASGVGEILAAASFYDYDAKYHNNESKIILDPELPNNAAKKIPEIAKAIFTAIDGYGLARVDFFVTDGGDIIFNEINTMPGFTSISMYPMLWEARGISKEKLIQDLINLAMDRD